MCAILERAFSDVQEKAGELLSPWTPSGFAMIGYRALREAGWNLDARASDAETSARAAQLEDALRALAETHTRFEDADDEGNPFVACAEDGEDWPCKHEIARSLLTEEKQDR